MDFLQKNKDIVGMAAIVGLTFAILFAAYLSEREEPQFMEYITFAGFHGN